MVDDARTRRCKNLGLGERANLLNAVRLITMPWIAPGQPGLLMGNLHSALVDAEIEVTSHSFFVDFAELMLNAMEELGERFDLATYGAFTSAPALGELVFAPVELSDWPSLTDLDRFGVTARTYEIGRHLRGLVPEFIDDCAAEISTDDTAVAVFTCPQEFLWPSLRLAESLRVHMCDVKIVLVGDRVDGPAGQAALDAFPLIDAVVGADSDFVIPTIAAGLFANSSATALPGGGGRDHVRTRVAAPASRTAALTTAPPPNYDEYFSRVRGTRVEGHAATAQWLPYEMSRGCWWAEASKCSFCALMGTEDEFASRSPSTVSQHLKGLMERHRTLQINFADWVIDKAGIQGLQSVFDELPQDSRYFLETRVDLSRADFESLGRHSVEVQLGIESLSPHLLRSMRKGTRVLQNIRALKWCTELHLPVTWNLMIGHPGEADEDYEYLLSLVPDLFHLAPPTYHRFRLKRLSPVFEGSEDFGVSRVAVFPWHRTCFPQVKSRTLFDLVDEYDFDCTPEVDAQVRGRVAAAIEEWNAFWPASSASLWHERGHDFVHIHDCRPLRARTRITLDGDVAKAYVACEDGAPSGRIAMSVFGSREKQFADRVVHLLAPLVERGFVFQEQGWYLSLSVARH